jgi:hypothetical protein
MTMLFEARELKSYAEPISEGDLKEGAVYFFVSFVDEEMLIPTFDTVVYVGRSLQADDVDQVYFQDIVSFKRGVRYETAVEGDFAVFHSGSRSELGHVFHYERALDQLLACSLRRRSSGREESEIRPPVHDEAE